MTQATFLRPPWWTPSAVYAVLVTPPTVEPLTLEEAKLRAGLSWADGDPRDGLMKLFITAARSQVEHDTGLALLTQTHRLELDVPATGIVPLPPQCTPVQTITDTVAIATGAPLVRSGVHLRGTSMAFDNPPPTRITVDVVSGWADAADLAARAPLLVHAVGLLTAHYATLGRDLASTDGPVPMPYGYEEAIGPHRLVWVT